MTSFPLYSNICNKISTNLKEFTDADKKNLQKMYKKCPEESHELIYALIKSYQIDNDIEPDSNTPFYGKVLKSGIKFDINNFPNKLQNILYEFIKMNLDKNR